MEKLLPLDELDDRQFRLAEHPAGAYESALGTLWCQRVCSSGQATLTNIFKAFFLIVIVALNNRATR